MTCVFKKNECQNWLRDSTFYRYIYNWALKLENKPLCIYPLWRLTLSHKSASDDWKYPVKTGLENLHEWKLNCWIEMKTWQKGKLHIMVEVLLLPQKVKSCLVQMHLKRVEMVRIKSHISSVYSLNNFWQTVQNFTFIYTKLSVWKGSFLWWSSWIYRIYSSYFCFLVSDTRQAKTNGFSKNYVFKLYNANKEKRPLVSVLLWIYDLDRD